MTSKKNFLKLVASGSKRKIQDRLKLEIPYEWFDETMPILIKRGSIPIIRELLFHRFFRRNLFLEQLGHSGNLKLLQRLLEEHLINEHDLAGITNAALESGHLNMAVWITNETDPDLKNTLGNAINSDW